MIISDADESAARNCPLDRAGLYNAPSPYAIED